MATYTCLILLYLSCNIIAVFSDEIRDVTSTTLSTLESEIVVGDSSTTTTWDEILVETSTPSINNHFEPIPENTTVSSNDTQDQSYDEKIKHGLQALQLQLLQQRTLMVLHHFQVAMPQLLAIQNQVEKLVKTNKIDRLYVPGHQDEISKLVSNLNTIEDEVLPVDKLKKIHSTLYSTSLQVLRVNSKWINLPKYERFQEIQSNNKSFEENLQDISVSINGRSWAVGIKNLADVKWSTIQSLKGVTLEQQTGGPETIVYNATKIYGFSVKNDFWAKSTHLLEAKELGIALVSMIETTAKRNRFCFDFFHTRDLRPGTVIRLTTCTQNTQDRELITEVALDGIKASARIQNFNEKFIVSITTHGKYDQSAGSAKSHYPYQPLRL